MGPTLGGLLSSYHSMLPAIIASSMFFCNFLFVLNMVPDTPSKNETSISFPLSLSSQHIEQRNSVMDVIKRIIEYSKTMFSSFRQPMVGKLLLLCCLYNLATIMVHSTFSVFLQYRYNLEPQSNGIVLRFVSLSFFLLSFLWFISNEKLGVESFETLLLAISRGFAIQFLLRSFNEVELLSYSSMLLAFAYFSCSFAPNIYIYLAILPLNALCVSVLGTCLTRYFSPSSSSSQIQ
jgi:hypothetical protein